MQAIEYMSIFSVFTCTQIKSVCSSYSLCYVSEYSVVVYGNLMRVYCVIESSR